MPDWMRFCDEGIKKKADIQFFEKLAVIDVRKEYPQIKSIVSSIILCQTEKQIYSSL